MSGPTTALPSLLVAASAAVIFTLGALHLWYTFRGHKLHPRDPELRVRLEQAPLVLNRQTTMWKAWVGFNASHGCGAVLFGAIYGYLALVDAEFLFDSKYLCAVGALMLASWLAIARFYWFSVPYRGILVAAVCYVGGVMLAWA